VSKLFSVSSAHLWCIICFIQWNFLSCLVTSVPEWLTAFKRYRTVYGRGKMSDNTTVIAHSMQREPFVQKNYLRTPQKFKLQEERLFCIAMKNEMYSKSSLHQNRKEKAFYVYPIWEKWRNLQCKFLRLIFNAENIVHAEILACFRLSISEKGKFLAKLYYCQLHSTLIHFWGISHLKLIACSIC